MAKKSKATSRPRQNLKKEVYWLVKQIPEGKVATYGQIAKKFQISNFKFQIDPRMIGWMLHQNKDPDVPCHRVVDRNGRIAVNFGFGGAPEQRQRLLSEGVKFIDEMHVDLAKCLWREDPKS